ncbi:MAG: hypothetical protein Q8P17_02625 [bacterium]|nr:hypothetical protein [bacterium]
MASNLFTTAPAGVSLEELQQAIAEVANELNATRDTKGSVQFARVHVGSVLIDPRDKTESFLVSYSDGDAEAVKCAVNVLEHATEIKQQRLARLEQTSSQWYFNKGDPCMT